MFDQLLNEAVEGMEMLSPLYWIALVITVIIFVIILAHSSNKSEKERENIFSLFIFITPYAPFIISSLWYLIANSTISLALVVNWIFALVSSCFLYFIISAVFIIFLGICLIGLDSINVVSFNRDNIFDVIFNSSFGFIYTYVLISFMLFNQFYCMFI